MIEASWGGGGDEKGYLILSIEMFLWVGLFVCVIFLFVRVNMCVCVLVGRGWGILILSVEMFFYGCVCL